MHNSFVSVCVYVSVRIKYKERYRVKRQICGNMKLVFFLKLSYSKLERFYTFVAITLRKALRLFNYYS